MLDLLNFLSGGVPGGLLILLFAIIAVIVFFRLLKSSEIITPQKSRKLQIIVPLALVFIYVTLWFVFRPPLPPQRILFLPTKTSGDAVEISGDVFRLPELFQRYARNNLNEKYLLHRWEWLLETIGQDSFKNISTWNNTALNIGVQYLIESEKSEEDNYTITVFNVRDNNNQQELLHGEMNIRQFIDALDQELKVFASKRSLPASPSSDYIKAKAYYHLEAYDKSLNLIKEKDDLDCRVLAAANHMRKGLLISFDRIKNQYVKFENEEFNEAKKILNGVMQENQDWPGIAYILGRMALREGDYLKANTYLKKAFIDDPANCRIHLALSYLLPERLAPIGYQNRIEILKRAVFLDPGYSTAVYELAKEYFESGTGTPTGTGTTLALKTMEEFREIKSDEPRILGLLASVYLRTSRIDDARAVFEKLLKMFPDDSDNYYNLGIVYYQKKNYEKALDYFLKAIEMDNNLDSYLYAAVIYRDLGEKEKALHYFRERVKRMTGEDDTYAREAMQGIRTILEEMKNDSVNAN